VALAEDRDRRADGPAEGNRCYAERAPRRRDLVYQADYCYSPRFASCSVFLAWAARNAAEPAYVTDAARKAWGSGIAMPEDGSPPIPGLGDEGGRGSADATPEEPGLVLPSPTPEGGLFGPVDPSERARRPATDDFDWVPASAWVEAPDHGPGAEADELEALAASARGRKEPGRPGRPRTSGGSWRSAGCPADAQAPPAQEPAGPCRRWWYADPLEREPLVRRRGGWA
jgi:hypothetical protein